jgi:branched-chain amino acid transport system substrate-binding protein
MLHVSRRGILTGAAALTLGRPAIAQGAPIKLGLMLPFSGTFAALGENIAAAFELCLQERGGKLGGRAVTLVRLDDESDPARHRRT